METSVRKYLSAIGSRGGRKSKRTLSAETARAMVRLREARRAYRRFHAQCFWSYSPEAQISESDIEWVVHELKKNGNREAWEAAQRLCR